MSNVTDYVISLVDVLIMEMKRKDGEFHNDSESLKHTYAFDRFNDIFLLIKRSDS